MKRTFLAVVFIAAGATPPALSQTSDGTGIISDCIVWGNGRTFPQLIDCSTPTYSCIQDWTGGGTGNISDDPLFTTGPMGSWYLSQAAAGRAARSPCVDAGSTAALELGLAGRTTRTDGVGDRGVVDIGFHYPIALPPAAPSSHTASVVSPTQIDLAWQDTSDDEDGFEIERKTGESGEWAQIAALGADIRRFQDDGLAPGTTYMYRVRARNPNGASGYSNTVGVTTPQVPDPPAAPTNLEASLVLWNRVDLVWMDNSDNETGFRIERRESMHSRGVLATVGPNVTSYSDDTVRQDHWYTYWVQAFNASGASAYSNHLSLKTAKPPEPPEAPSNLEALVLYTNAIQLEWRDNSESELGFELERGAPPGREWKMIIRISGITKFIDMGVRPRTTYLYRVRAYNSTGHSPYSNEVSAMTYPRYDTPPDAPTNLEAYAAAHDRISLRWQDNSGIEEGFRIERRTGATGAWEWNGSVPADTEFYQDTGVLPGVTYAYRVSAFTFELISPYSNEASATALEEPGAIWNVELLAELPLPEAVDDVHVSDGIAGVEAGTNGRAYFIDVSNPRAPEIAGRYETAGPVNDIHLSEGVAYLSEGEKGVEIVDFTSPSEPVRLSIYDRLQSAADVEVVGRYAYVMDKNKGMVVLDVADPSSPTWAASYKVPGNIFSLFVEGNTAYVSTSRTGAWVGLEFVDVGNPAAPVLLGVYEGQPAIMKVFVEKSVVYLWRALFGLEIADVSDLTSPRPLSYYEASYLLDIHPADGLTYITTAFENLQILNAINPERSVTCGAYAPTTVTARRIFVDRGLAYVTYRSLEGRRGFGGGLWILRYTGGTGLPNLAPDASDFGPAAPLQTQPGDPFALGTLVENIGAGPAGRFWTEVWGSRTGGLMLDYFLTDSRVLADGLPVAGSDSWIVEQPFYSVPDGPYTVVFAADRPDEVAEGDERDNRQAVAGKRLLVIRPQANVDLVVEGFTLSPNPAQSGQPISLSGTVTNRGAERSAPFWIEFWGSAAWPHPTLGFMLCDSIRVDSLAAGAAIELADYPRQLYDVPAGLFMAGCVADRDDRINELDETNNYHFVEGQTFNAAFPLEREAPPAEGLADVAITGADFWPHEPVQAAPGDPTTFTIELTNSGDTVAGPFWLEYWGSRDGGLSLAELLTASDRIDVLAPGESVFMSPAKPLYSVADGPYTVVIVANRLAEFAESTTVNNRFIVPGKRLLVVRPPTEVDLEVEDFWIVWEGPGRELQLLGTVSNSGARDSGPFWIEFWVSPGDPDYPALVGMACDSIYIENLAAPGGAGESWIDLSQFSRTLYDTIPPGEYAVILYVDRPDWINETDETNNYGIVREFVLPAR